MEKDRELIRKGDLVCHQVLRANIVESYQKKKKNLIILYIVGIYKKKKILTVMCPVPTLTVRILSPLDATLGIVSFLRAG